MRGWSAPRRSSISKKSGGLAGPADRQRRGVMMDALAALPPHALRHTWRTVAADCGVDELLAHFMLGHVPQNISQAYITRLVLSAGPALRQAQRKVSKRILHLLGSDPTLASTAA
jgi:integrase